MIAKINNLIFKLTKQDDYYLKNSAGRLVGVFLLLAIIQFGAVCIADYVDALPSSYELAIWISSIVLLLVMLGVIINVIDSADDQYARSYQYTFEAPVEIEQTFYDRSVDESRDINVDIFRRDRRTISSDEVISGDMLKTMKDTDTVVGIRLTKSGVYVENTYYMHVLDYEHDGDLNVRYNEFVIDKIEIGSTHLSISTAGGIHKHRPAKVAAIYFKVKDPDRAKRLNKERKALEARESMM